MRWINLALREEVIDMSHSMKIGAIIGAALSLIAIPMGLGEAMLILSPLYIVVGALSAEILNFIVRKTGRETQVPLLRKDLTFLEHFFYASILAFVSMTAFLPVVLQAREAARRSPCKNNLRNLSHACGGDLVILDRYGLIDRIATCPLCDQMGRHFSVTYESSRLRFYNTMGRPLSDEELPEGIREVVLERLHSIDRAEDD